MLTVNKLEKVMELEATLREQYQGQLDEKDAEIGKLTNEKTALETNSATANYTIAQRISRKSSPLLKAG